MILKRFSWGLVLCILLLIPSCLFASGSNRLYYAQNGFSIMPLEGTVENENYQVAIMYLPANRSFAPNVNIQIQPYDGTMDEYIDLSKQQFQMLGFKIITIKTQDNSAFLEYSGSFQGIEFHWCARVFLREGKVYLVIGTALSASWSEVSAQILACVDSFQLEETKQ